MKTDTMLHQSFAAFYSQNSTDLSSSAFRSRIQEWSLIHMDIRKPHISEGVVVLGSEFATLYSKRE